MGSQHKTRNNVVPPPQLSHGTRSGRIAPASTPSEAATRSKARTTSSRKCVVVSGASYHLAFAGTLRKDAAMSSRQATYPLQLRAANGVATVPNVIKVSIGDNRDMMVTASVLNCLLRWLPLGLLIGAGFVLSWQGVGQPHTRFTECHDVEVLAVTCGAIQRTHDV